MKAVHGTGMTVRLADTWMCLLERTQARPADTDDWR
jgi:hypothetical protein